MLRLTMISVLMLHLFLSAATAQVVTVKGPWPQFHGPARNNLSPDTGLMTKWPDGGPPLVWDTRGAGRGYASLAITDNRLYTLGDAPSTAEDKDEYVTCFDQADGKQLWKTKTGPAWTSGSADWQSSRSTPTVDGDLLWVLTPHGKLLCLQTVGGQQVWQKDLAKDFEGKKGDGWGYSESVLIDGDKVVCTPGGSKSTMVAMNKKSGEPIWTAVWPEDRGAGHASIVISEIGGTRVYVQTTAGGEIGVRAADGKLLWTYPIDQTIAVIPTPIVRGDLVFFAAGYTRGGALLRQVPGSDGEIKIEEVYPLNKELANKHGGIVLAGEYLFGDSDDRGLPFCAELMTGKQAWKERGSGKGSMAVTVADGHLYLRYANGVMVLAQASPEKYQELSSFKIPDSGERPSWSHPVVIGGKLYLREQDRIFCYDVKAKN